LVERTSEGDICALRFGRAVRASLARLEGPDGARSAIAMARVALSVLEDASLGAAAVERAVAADGGAEEFTELLDRAPALARDRESASALIEAVRGALTKPYATVGAPALRLVSRIASALGDSQAAAQLLVDAAKRAPDDERVIDEADGAVS